MRRPPPAPSRGLVLVGPQEPEQAPHVGERLPSGLLDREERLPGARRVLLEEEPGGAGLNGHDADAVRDHVVEVARDAGALGGDRSARSLLALALEPCGLLLELDGALRSPPEREGGCREPACDEQEADDAEVGVGVGDDELQPMRSERRQQRSPGRSPCLRSPAPSCRGRPRNQKASARERAEKGVRISPSGGSPGICDGDTHERGEDEDRRRKGEAAPQEQRQGPEQSRGHRS